jgi:hypothetical protein
MKDKFKSFLSQYGPISGILVVLLIVVFGVNVATGFGPGGEFAPGGEHDVSKQNDKSEDTSDTTGNPIDSNNLVGSGDANIVNDGTGETPLGGSTQTITPGNEDGSGSVGFNPDGTINTDTLPQGAVPEPDINPNLPLEGGAGSELGGESGIETGVLPPAAPVQ